MTNRIQLAEAVERRSPNRISGHDLWLAHNALLDYVAGLEHVGDRMARVIGVLNPKSESSVLWADARKSNPKREA